MAWVKEAEFKAVCAAEECERVIRPGDEIVFSDTYDGLWIVHVDCADPEDEVRHWEE